MDQDQWKKLEAIIDKAMSFPSRARQQQHLDEACRGDELLHQQATELLNSIHEAEQSKFLDR